MHGLELSKSYYEEFGKPMLESAFPDLMPFLAVGLFGQGSECFGYDDALSRDHDFEPGFCLYLPGEDVVDRRTAFLLERAYAKLPREYNGVSREFLAPVGGARRGVLRTGEVFTGLVGAADGVLSGEQWLSVPEQGLAEATNGLVFFDGYGEVTAIRQRLAYFPEDVRLKKLAGNLLLMAQSGQYNYSRCIGHGERAAAQLAVFNYVESFMSAAFLLNRKYQPYYKWRFRAFRELPVLGDQSGLLEELLTTGNDTETAERKRSILEETAAILIAALKESCLSGRESKELEAHAFEINDRIRDGNLRNLHILAAV